MTLSMMTPTFIAKTRNVDINRLISHIMTNGGEIFREEKEALNLALKKYGLTNPRKNQ